MPPRRESGPRGWRYWNAKRLWPAARGELEALQADHAAAVAECDRAAGELAAARELLARLRGEVEVLESAVEGEDTAAAREEQERRRKILEELDEHAAKAPPVDDAEAERIAGKAEVAEKEVKRITAALLRERGALEQVGGAYAEEQAMQASERVKTVRKREEETEIEYEAWKLWGRPCWRWRRRRPRTWAGRWSIR